MICLIYDPIVISIIFSLVVFAYFSAIRSNTLFTVLVVPIFSTKVLMTKSLIKIVLFYLREDEAYFFHFSGTVFDQKSKKLQNR